MINHLEKEIPCEDATAKTVALLDDIVILVLTDVVSGHE